MWQNHGPVTDGSEHANQSLSAAAAATFCVRCVFSLTSQCECTAMHSKH